MQTFLEKAAAHVFKQFSGNLHRLVVVLPTQRACFFFKRALAMQSDIPVFAPKILPIDDFITEAADAELIEPISLLWLLYDICKETDPYIQFDRFTSWAHPLLQDFDKIDQYLVNTKDLFGYLTKAKAIERWQPDMLPNQTGPIESLIIDKYFRLWENLDRTYALLKERLGEQKKAYRGMMYRWVAEHPEKLEENQEVLQYIFVGLNALSHAEEKILKDLVKARKGQILWDTDSYYMEKNLEVKAGDLLRRYKGQGKLGEWNWQTNDLLTGKKDIHFIGVLNASMQGKVASQIYINLLSEDTSLETEQTYSPDAGMTAIVLPDENLLMTVLQSLDPAVEDFNITMGLSLRNSSLYTLVNLLFDLQYLTLSGNAKEKKSAKFNHRHVVKVLTHPFIKHYEQLFLQAEEDNANTGSSPRNYIRYTLQYITQNNKVFLTSTELQDLGKSGNLYKVLFTSWDGEARKALHCFYELIDVLREVYKAHQDAIETEYLFRFYTIIKRLDGILQEREAKREAEPLSLRSFKLFLYELFKQNKIPFSGEPVSKLQIMGMLETRTLDFENVIILSANEKVLPGIKKQNSLIPLDISLQFGLPTYRSQEATISYHFYRLLQRAKRVYLLHVLPSETYSAGEKSRFLHQIEYELARQNPAITVHHHTVKLADNSEAIEPVLLQVAKSDKLLAHLSEQIERGISPTQINTYVHCSLRYYYSYLSNLKEEEEVQESMSAGTFGNLVHNTLEEIDKEIASLNKAIYADDLKQMLPTVPLRVQRIYTATHPGGTVQNGLNYLLYKVAIQVITNLLQHQIDNGLFPLEILGLEKTLSTGFSYESAGKKVNVQLYGRIDRIDKVGNTIRVIDYKTGRVERNQLRAASADIEQILVTNPEADKVRQLWLYKYILAKRMLHEKGLRLADRYLKAEDHTLVSGIFSFRNIGEGLMTDQLKFENGTEESLEEFVSHSEKYLEKLISRMLNPDQPFERTPHIDSCMFCPYTNICGR